MVYQDRLVKFVVPRPFKIRDQKGCLPPLKIVHRKPKHTRSRGSVEKVHQDTENILSTWVQDENTNKWNKGLRFAQLENRAYHSRIKRTLYKVLFGYKIKLVWVLLYLKM
ncbi:KRAB-A domain-containing protein 2 [Habropoda laboriosa]|uniref:KRAB-A domain-containing protein 2 n=1 Tax=Habropoda laboriosa TaxID=597456 RepID=A0A0L7R424_9HYME|nr:KRAB-A domain-containing protein 2 [Habropoda laboriosa]